MSINNITKKTELETLEETMSINNITKKTELETLEETIQFYSEDTSRRSAEGCTCRYNGPNGKHCAAARLMTKEALALEDIEGESIEDLILKHGRGILKPEHKAHSLEFLKDLQDLHDDIEYWEDDKGLSNLGKAYVSAKFNYTI
jgi:hypothetical protein